MSIINEIGEALDTKLTKWEAEAPALEAHQR